MSGFYAYRRGERAPTVLPGLLWNGGMPWLWWFGPGSIPKGKVLAHYLYRGRHRKGPYSLTVADIAESLKPKSKWRIVTDATGQKWIECTGVALCVPGDVGAAMMMLKPTAAEPQIPALAGELR